MVLCAALIGLVVAADFALFIKELRGFRRPVATPSADSIVVLTGGAKRADIGLGLLRKGSAKALILSGVDPGSDAAAIFFPEKISSAELGSIILEKGSANTYENAIETRGVLAGLKHKSIVLITSSYHMKRALMTFKQVMPPDVVIIAYPVESESGFFLMFSEFIKYNWYEARFYLSN